MRRDLFIGIFLSLAIHAGVVYFGDIKPKPKHKVVHEEPPSVQITLPPVEPDVEESTEAADQAAPTDIAPPMQTDIPTVVTQDSFVQTMEPPPPEGLKMNTGVITVPTGRTQIAHTEIFDISKLDRAPQPTYDPAPPYPFDLKRQSIEGTVTVDFIIDSSGNVQDAFALNSTNHGFEENAVLTVLKWRFRPGRKNGRAVATHVQQPIVFKISGDDSE